MRAVVQCVSSASVAVNGEVVSNISRGLMVLVGIGEDDTAADVATITNKIKPDFIDSLNAQRTFAGRPMLLRAFIYKGKYLALRMIESVSLRLFPDTTDPEKFWRTSVKDIDGEILCVSQFTLFANTTKGNKPDFHRAMASAQSKEMYSSFLERLRQSYKPEKIKDGIFGAMMSVNLTNEGPVTVTLDSRKFEYVDNPNSSGSKEKVKPNTKTNPSA